MRWGSFGRGVAYGAARRLRKAAAGLCLVTGLGAGLATGPAAAGEAVIAALGDSLTQGYGLPQEQGFVPQLQGWLEARGHEVRLINAGVSGDTTAGGLSRVDWTLSGEVDGMIVALGGNDLLRGIDPAVSRANLDGILEAARAAGVEVLLVGIRAPGNYGPDYKAAFEAMYPDLAEEHGALLVEDFLGGLDAAQAAGLGMGELMQPDGIHPSARGVEAIVAALGPAVVRLIERIEDG
jgi:acyl-CoA thioesterase-1